MVGRAGPAVGRLQLTNRGMNGERLMDDSGDSDTRLKMESRSRWKTQSK